MSPRAKLSAWWASRRPPSLRDQLEVRVDTEGVTVRVLADLDPSWNQGFQWSDVVRVCLSDGGLFGSDMIQVQLRGDDTVVAVPTEAEGGAAFFSAVCERGLLPEHVWRRAIAETGGGTHCWPPGEEAQGTGSS